MKKFTGAITLLCGYGIAITPPTGFHMWAASALLLFIGCIILWGES